MAEKYELDYPRWDDNILRQLPINKIIDTAIIMQGLGKSGPVVDDMLQQYKTRGSLTLGQQNYLCSLIKSFTPEYEQYETDFFTWYDSRPDIQEIYHYAMSQDYIYVINPDTYQYIGRDSSEFKQSWFTRPANTQMFWRSMSDWTVKRYRVIKSDSVFEEGDLVQLRKPFVNDYRYDPLYDGSTTPPPTDIRLGTVMQMTQELHNRSRAGKGSRLVNVLWMGKTEMLPMPERAIKLHERKKRVNK